jgi:hypothetical protein
MDLTSSHMHSLTSPTYEAPRHVDDSTDRQQRAGLSA